MDLAESHDGQVLKLGDRICNNGIALMYQEGDLNTDTPSKISQKIASKQKEKLYQS